MSLVSLKKITAVYLIVLLHKFDNFSKYQSIKKKKKEKHPDWI